MPKTPMTRHGAGQLREELQRLRSVERPAVTQAIADARSHGDLSENAEYDAARERQGFIEARIGDIESKLANAQEIDPKLLDAEGLCVFGATVDLEEDGGEKTTWQIVGEDEADIKAGKISYSSPPACGCRKAAGPSSACATPTSTPQCRSRSTWSSWAFRCSPRAAPRRS